MCCCQIQKHSFSIITNRIAFTGCDQCNGGKRIKWEWECPKNQKKWKIEPNRKSVFVHWLAFCLIALLFINIKIDRIKECFGIFFYKIKIPRVHSIAGICQRWSDEAMVVADWLMDKSFCIVERALCEQQSNGRTVERMLAPYAACDDCIPNTYYSNENENEIITTTDRASNAHFAIPNTMPVCRTSNHKQSSPMRAVLTTRTLFDSGFWHPKIGERNL